MTWSSIEPEVREVAERVCTARQLEVFRLRSEGHGMSAIARILGISRSAARDRWKSAKRNVNLVLGKEVIRGE